MKIVYSDDLPQSKESERLNSTMNRPGTRLEPAKKLSADELLAAAKAAVKQIPVFALRKMTAKDVVEAVFSHNKINLNGKGFYVLVMKDSFKFYYDPDSGKIGFSQDHAERAVPQRKLKLREQPAI